jgi:hypothetical protein
MGVERLIEVMGLPLDQRPHRLELGHGQVAVRHGGQDLLFGGEPDGDWPGTLAYDGVRRAVPGRPVPCQSVARWPAPVRALQPRPVTKEGRMVKEKDGEKVSYDEFKEYEGQKYTGMKIGRAHKWYYDEGEWKEKKITPDLWEISYAVTKRRAGRAPEGSGVPVGTEYHWYILAHQNVEKLNANDYTTSMSGLKFKIAHKRADSSKWSVQAKGQRRRMIRFLRGVIDDLEQQEEDEKKTKAATKSDVKKKAKPKRKSSAKQPATPSSMKKPSRPASRKKAKK